jgi:hypothetical protein
VYAEEASSSANRIFFAGPRQRQQAAGKARIKEEKLRWD